VALSIPPFGFWPLAALGLGVLYLRLAGLSLRARMGVGFVAATSWLVPSLWFATAFTGFGFLAMVVIESVFLPAACALVPPDRGRALAFPGAVTLAEACREAWPFGGVPVGGVELGQAEGWLLPAARVGGHLLLVGLAALAGVALAEAGHAVWRSAWRPVVSAVAAAAVVAAAVVAGHLAPAGGPEQGAVSVAAVQGGGPRGLRASQGRAAQVYAAELVPTLRLRPPVDLVVWPEDVVALNRPLAGSEAERQLAALARYLHTTLVAGVTEPVGSSRFRNFAAVLGPSGRLVGHYEKLHRVPFGEYVPLRGLLRHLVSLRYVPRDAIAGHRVGFLRTAAGPLGVMISYEVFFAQPARAAVAAGAELLVVPTNDASYATVQLPSQEVAADRLRAVEEGRSLVQAAPTGYTAFVDRDGRVLARSSLGQAAILKRAVARYRGRTLYSLGGDWPLRGAAGALVGGGLLVSRHRRRPPQLERRPAT
jgi:apolipoprotein N-acyltransferase